MKVLLGLLLLLSAAVHAQDYPSKPIRMLVPFAPDGYTLLMAHTGEFAVNPALFDNVPYELERDFVAITMVSDAPMLYLAHARAPFNTFQELVAQAKAKPGSIPLTPDVKERPKGGFALLEKPTKIVPGP